ncbi:MAG: methionine biosynthesis protein MetW [Candidatus Nealsonbacteria bacterium CG10_big_fil_rev_8_21_14_0_10_36_24]|uniref:Methionine biosynthesis protein MetW n=2 Tax=Candidatus Nealsoniibacteriota TaxID=1817911 RepID=A0A2H0YNP0_9BACT|nr:MAG: methionine biosynthesis protein MetW [Candidatus Nealsonbacteria bacterium CG10_big_fil_rev_8_21_14_0_10_36_24]PIS40080.1 MAG: methionine biosynthesis protein MetW [Candidatus Nealsonbacteria bacterium CG08_land_8_20_14_0_20_36_22]
MRDNRNYNWKEEVSERPEYSYIEQWITPESKVVDLGCGDCSLLTILKKKKNIFEFGIDISESGIAVCKKKGLGGRAGRIDVKLEDIPDNSFDFSLCNITLQMVMYPEILLQEMKRISRYQIISFPNFAFFKNRLELLLKGRMPKTMLGGYNWYNTGHIHQLSIKDFREFCSNNGLKIIDVAFINKEKTIKGNIAGFLEKFWPNFFASIVIYLCTKQYAL